MAREIVVYTWCDPCFQDHQERNEGTEVNLALGELGMHKPFTLSLCERHRKELYDPLLVAVQAYGQKAEADVPKQRAGVKVEPGDWSCPECDHVAPNKAALSSHVRNMHDTSLGALNGEPLDYQCPECDRGFTRPQGLAAHRSRSHGVPGTKGK